MIQPGQVLDSYELLERVGQGGMAVVYRAIDQSLRRVVAVKVLHRHLAESAEARDRFEREAHAVAKLRHDNILEIYAFSGSGDDSYIVTEFIEGETLKQAITARPIGFPEVGAMIVSQIARALAHAHAAGILHRDVKPENVMIRSDGVVKLMDFGISQMVDLDRLTVTGQLLGSPAYMSPEHVEGQPLDFRTDVFACGIVLYQIAVGRLPFEGKNPHEILKRIATCEYVDPCHANPRIATELGRIITRALARRPEDRYADITQMVAALDSFIADSGLGSSATELARYFKAPASYEMALQTRLVDHLLRRSQALLSTQRAAGLQALDRVLTLSPDNAAALEMLARLSKRRRVLRVVVGVPLLVSVAALAFGLRRLIAPPTRAITVASLDLPTEIDETTRVTQREHAIVPAVMFAETHHDADVVAPPQPRAPDHGGTVPAIVPPPPIHVSVMLAPPTSELRIGDGPWQSYPGGRADVPMVGDEVAISARNEACCEASSRKLHPSDAARPVSVSLAYLPAQIIPRCDDDHVQVRIDGRVARLGVAAIIPFGDTTQDQKTVMVEFVGQRISKHQIKVAAAQTQDVRCDSP